MPLPPNPERNVQKPRNGRLGVLFLEASAVSFSVSVEAMGDGDVLTRVLGGMGALALVGTVSEFYEGRNTSPDYIPFTFGDPLVNTYSNTEPTATAWSNQEDFERGTLYRRQLSPDYQLAMASMDAMSNYEQIEAMNLQSRV